MCELSSCPDWMEPWNNVTYFALLGLTQNPKEQKVLFVLFLFFYILTMVGNLFIFVTITVSKTLNLPRYFFLACLPFIDLICSSSITQRLISDLFLGKNTISFESCITQLFTEHFFGGPRYLFCWWWTMTAMQPSARPCIIWWPWGRGCVLCCW